MLEVNIYKSKHITNAKGWCSGKGFSWEHQGLGTFQMVFGDI
jgi:hypothetical protein